MSFPNSLTDTLRHHDQAFMDWLGTCRVDYGVINGVNRDNQPILRVMSSPERAADTISELLINTGWLRNGTETAAEAGKRIDVLPRPVLLVRRGTPVLDLRYAGVPKRLRRAYFDPVTLKWQQAYRPSVYLTPYTVIFWGEVMATRAYWEEWLASELGHRGAQSNELFIPVNHGSEIGVNYQAVTVEGPGQDLSDLETEDSRSQRLEYTMNLRTFHYRRFDAAVDHADVFVNQPVWVSPQAGVLVPDGTGIAADSAPVLRSGNLFKWFLSDELIPTRWQRTGNATVSRASMSPTGQKPHDALRIGVVDTSDAVVITGSVTPLDVSGISIFEIGFQYIASATSKLRVWQRDASDTQWESVTTFTLPARTSWGTFRRYVAVTRPAVSIAIEGVGVASVVTVGEISVRRLVLSQSMPAAVWDGTSYIWSGLPTGPYLYGLVMAQTGATGTVTFQNDDNAPTLTFIDPSDSDQRTLTRRTAPVNGVLTITPTGGPPVESTFLYRYYGGYDGSDV